jgi:hypothetical protein
MVMFLSISPLGVKTLIRNMETLTKRIVIKLGFGRYPQTLPSRHRGLMLVMMFLGFLVA